MDFDEVDVLQADTRFVINDDAAAEWAMKKILEAQKERDRLLRLVADEQIRLVKKQEKIQKDYETDTSFLSGCLQDYMGRVKCRELKSSKKYQLLSGTLVLKRGGTAYKRDDDALVKWLDSNGYDGLVKVSRSPKWADLKKLVQTCGDSVIISGTGEVVEGITAEENPDTFLIEEAQ